MNKIELKLTAKIEGTILVNLSNEDIEILKNKGKLTSVYNCPVDETTDDLFTEIVDNLDDSMITEINIEDIKKAKHNGKIGPDITFIPGKGFVAIEEDNE